MANTVIALKKSQTPSAAPSDLANGELAINYADGILYYKNVTGQIVSFSSGGYSFSTINANNTLIVADTTNDILTIEPGSGIQIVGDAINDKITISATPGSGSMDYAYANAIGAASNGWANTVVAGANGWANTVGTSANAYSDSVSAASNGWANTVGTSANAYAVIVGAASNGWTNTVVAGANAWTNTVFGYSNTYAETIGAASNTWANGVGTAANSYSDTVGAASNGWANTVGTSANAYSVTVGAASNGWANTVGTSANVYSDAVGAASNGWANTVVAGANAWTNTVFGYANTRMDAIGVAANTYANNTFVPKIGNSTITGDLTVTGNLSVGGNSTTINTQSLNVTDPLIYLAGNNYVSDIVDIGFVANYVNATGYNVHTGFFRDATVKEYYVFEGYDKEPEPNHIDTAGNNFTISVLNTTLRTSNVILNGANLWVWINNAYTQANAAPGISNSYAVTVGAASNGWANTVVAGANAWSNTKVSSVTGTAGQIYSSGGTTPTLNLITTSVTAATYGNSSIIPVLTVDSYGRITSAANVSVSASGGGGGYFDGNNGSKSPANFGDIFRIHSNTLSTNVTILSGNNALCAGPITIATGQTLTIETGARTSIV